MLRNLSRGIKLNFEWSFRPIILFLRFLGVDLLPPSTRIKRWMSHCYVLFCLFIFNFGINIYYRFLSEGAYNFDLTAIYNYAMKGIITIAYVGGHLNLVFFIPPRFANLMKSFRLLENEINEDNDQRIFIQIRRFALCILTFLILLRLEIDFLCLYLDISNQYPVLESIVGFFLGWTQMFIQLSLILFAVCCYAAASSLDLIQREINRFDLIKMSPLLALNQLKKWKRCHALVSEIFDEIDDCFSPSIFLSVIHLLVRLIDHFVFKDCLCLSFATIDDAEDSSVFSQYIFMLSLICFPVDHLRFKTERLLNELLLLRLPKNEPAVDELANGLAIQIFQSMPQSSAMGWFDIDQSLILTVFDQVINYYFVLSSDLRDYVFISGLQNDGPIETKSGIGSALNPMLGNSTSFLLTEFFSSPINTTT